MAAPLRVFLDSSDYSDLSDDRKLGDGLSPLLNWLRQVAESGRVEFYFSGPLLSEMAPTSNTVAASSIRRARLVAELCGKNALVSPDRIFKHEIQLALGLSPSLNSIFSKNGDWFPEGALELDPIKPGFQIASLKDALKGQPISREQRRKMHRSLVKNGKPAEFAAEIMKIQARNFKSVDLPFGFPIHEDDGRILARYVVGDATAAQATAAMRNSLGNPAWIVQASLHSDEALTKFTQWTREPGHKLIVAVQALIESTSRLRQLESLTGLDLTSSRISTSAWMRQVDEMLVRIANRLAQELLSIEHSALTRVTLDAKCPGISCAVRSLGRAWGTSLTETPRQPKPSDFADALHATYAPYLDVFRTDSFMAPHVSRSCRHSEVKVVGRLADLRTTIEAALADA